MGQNAALELKIPACYHWHNFCIEIYWMAELQISECDTREGRELSESLRVKRTVRMD